MRDLGYQNILTRKNPEATHGYSLHTTGWAFDVERKYASREQALAFQFMLDRLQALNLIAWVREPAAIHVTVGRRGEGAARAASGSSRPRTASAVASGVMPRRRSVSEPGRRRAEAVDRDVRLRVARPAERDARLDGDRRAGRAAGPRSGRPRPASSKSSQLGIETTRAFTPSAASASCAATATSTSPPVATIAASSPARRTYAPRATPGPRALEHGQVLPRQREDGRAVEVLEDHAPRLGGLGGVAGAQHGQAGDRPQGHEVLDGLVRRAVLAERDGVVGEDPRDVGRFISALRRIDARM